MPAAGAMVQSIKYTLGQLESHHQPSVANSTDDFKATMKLSHEPEVIGKPNPYAIELIKMERQIKDSSR
jgi:hypothetical protein